MQHAPRQGRNTIEAVVNAGPMKFGVSYSTGTYGTDPERLAAAARYAEESGFESFYLPEHMALHVGARVGDFEIPPATPIADPLECLRSWRRRRAGPCSGPRCSCCRTTSRWCWRNDWPPWTSCPGGG